MSREAMKLALDALVFASYEDTDYDDVCDRKVREARNALRQALEKEQEPVAWASSLDFDDDDQEIIPAKDKGKLGTSNCDIPLYTTPKQWVGLTDDAVFELADTNLYEGGKNYGVLAFAKAIDQALKEKNQ